MRPLILPFLFLGTMCFAQAQTDFTTTGPPKGSLIIAGGGRLDTAVINKFYELAGGKQGHFIYIPTAGEGTDEAIMYAAQRAVERWKADLGEVKIDILHTRDPATANQEEFYAPLKTATGVWISGGRQWRLADSYLGTKTHEELFKVLERGGVIAGTSAGATIQGSYLIRGDTRGNTIIMGDHEAGFGFVTNIAIDQHLFVRNRQFDMFELLEHRPELLGIGLDEGAAILVQGDEFEVMTDNYVVAYDGTRFSAERDTTYQLPKGSKEFYMLRKGQRYDLKERKLKPRGGG